MQEKKMFLSFVLFFPHQVSPDIMYLLQPLIKVSSSERDVLLPVSGST